MKFLKKVKQNKQKRNNTIELKYQSLLEENLKEKEKIIALQNKVILLQEEKDIYKEELIKTTKKDVVKLRARKKEK